MVMLSDNRTVSTAPRSRARFPGFAVITAAIAVVGLVVLLYPSTAAWVSQYQQSQLISEYGDQVRTLGSAGQVAALETAREYNADLSGGAQVAAGQRIPTSDGSTTPAQYHYDDILSVDSTGLMARLKIPSINLDLPIYHGTSDKTLLEGVGHLEGSALPIGGAGTQSVLTAHRGLASAELFTNLDKVQLGNTFTIEVFGEVLTYQVINTRVVEPDQTESLFPQAGRDLVTLVTCTPLGINSHRILVTGERVLPTPASDVAQLGQAPDVPGFPWWIVWFAAGFALIVAYLLWSRRWIEAENVRKLH